MALAAMLPASALAPVSRGTSTSPRQVRQINTAQHALTARNATPRLKAAAQAPEHAVEVPFTHDLGKAGTEVKNYTSINVNGDNREWQYGKVNGYCACMVPNAADIDNNDDWLITVPIHLPAGDYVVSFEVGMMGSGATGVELEVKLGTAPTVEGMIAEVAPRTMYTEKNMTAHEFNCAIPEEGYYYLGFHCTTPKSTKGTLKLANLSMRQGSVTPPVTVDPPAAGTLTWELAPKGELKATVTYTAPTLTKSGAELTEISKVELTSRWGVDKFTYENVTPGQVITQDVEMYAGFNNRFTATAYTGDTAGETVEHKNIFCGPDTPFPPTDVTLTVSDDYRSATLSWTAPGEVGENGGYVDTEAMTYYVFDAFGSYYDPALYTTDQTSITINYDDLEGQDFFAYQVTAGVGEYYSLDCASNIATVGQPGALPFTESFKNGYYDGIWLIDPESTGSGTMQYGTITDDYFASLFDPEDPDAPAPLKSQDGDNGFYYWLPIEKDAMLGLVSVRADISAAANPVLDFRYQGQGSEIQVLAAGRDGAFRPLQTIDLQAEPTTGWTAARVSLADFKAEGAVQFEIRLKAVHNDDDHTWSVPLDNIRVHDLMPVDVQLVSLNAPATAHPGETVTLHTLLANNGTDNVADATATLLLNGAEIRTAPVDAIAAFGNSEMTFTYDIPFDAPETLVFGVRADVEGDGFPTDNSGEATVTVLRPDYATVTDLTATASDGEVTLSWSAPVNDASTPVTVNEDFESADYTPMSISGAGGWTVFDGDGENTYNIFRELYNPYQTRPIGFQLFNRVEAQVPDMYWLDAEPHSGDSFMMAPSAQSALNDNWLISPELSGNAQTVTFWAKSFSLAWPETMKVYYSTAGNSVDELTAEAEISGLPESGELPEEWTEYSFTLPEGARHFAINHDAYDTVALMVDDFTFEGKPAIPVGLAVTGYHLFCNGQQITDEPLDALTYTHNPVADITEPGEYTFEYAVVPVYNIGGAGAVSNRAEVTVSVSGITEIAADTLGADAVVYDLRGIRVPRTSLTPGIYIVVAGGNAVKARIR